MGKQAPRREWRDSPPPRNWGYRAHSVCAGHREAMTEGVWPGYGARTSAVVLAVHTPPLPLPSFVGRARELLGLVHDYREVRDA
jgi:hypothetical protein